MSLMHNTDHAGDAKSRLAEQYKGRPNLAALLDAINGPVQTLEDAIWALIAGRALATATGATLDKIGAAVGCTRDTGESDDNYRGRCYAQIIVNTSEGMPETVYALIRQLGATGGRFKEYGNYDADLQYIGTLLVDDDGLLSALVAATPPIDLRVTEYMADAFGFDGDPEALGFGDGVLARSVT